MALHPPGSPITAVVSLRRALQLGFVTGFTFFLVLLHWLPRLPRENVTIPFMMVPALILAAAYLALYPMVAVWIAAWLARRGVPLGLALPPVWVLSEWLRGSGLLGFSWGSAGYGLTGHPHLIQFASITGVWGVSLWVLLVNGLIHLHLSRRATHARIGALVVLLVVAVGPYLQGAVVLGRREAQAGFGVGLVQPNIGKDKWRRDVRDTVITRILKETRLLAEESEPDRPGLLVWPETAIPARVPRDPAVLARVRDLVDRTGIPLLAGYPDGERDEAGRWWFTNTAGLVLPGRGIVETYDKRHLVPFSEHFPLPFLNRYDFGQSNFTPGSREVVFGGAGPPFGVMICFESIFPEIARGYARRGARYLINITNDQWFGDSAAPVQHFRMNVMRCIETRLGLARAANTGISGVIDPYGIVMERTPVFVSRRVNAVVPLGEGTTFYVRYGDWILWVLAVGVAGMLLLARRRGEPPA